MQILETKTKRQVKSENYNTIFDKITGFFARWGKTQDEDPIMASSPEILDLEISSGKCHNSCPFCYKQNSADKELHNMSLLEFKTIFHKVAQTIIEIITDKDIHRANYNASFKCFEKAKTKEDIIKYVKKFYEHYELTEKIKDIRIYNKGLLNQIAFGITSPTDNKDFFKMMEYCREFDVVPNYTCNGVDMTQKVAEKSVKLCGAIALSVCSNYQATLNAIDRLHKLNFKQVNIHVVAMDSTFELIKKLIYAKNKDKRLKGLNAIVMLRYKPKGTNAGKFKQMTKEQYAELLKLAEEQKIGIGFDSCSAPMYLSIIQDDKEYKAKSICAEPCESSLFSSYINSYGEFFACSFCEGEKGTMWETGIDVLHCKDFITDVWQHEKTKQFREKLLNNCRNCPMFELEK